MEIKYNQDKVTHIQVFEKRWVSAWYKVSWIPLRTSFFGLIKTPAGWYYSDGDKYTKEITKDQVAIDRVLYYKPHIEIYINKELVEKKFFESMDELNHFIETHFPNFKNFKYV